MDSLAVFKKSLQSQRFRDFDGEVSLDSIIMHRAVSICYELVSLSNCYSVTKMCWNNHELQKVFSKFIIYVVDALRSGFKISRWTSLRGLRRQLALQMPDLKICSRKIEILQKNIIQQKILPTKNYIARKKNRDFFRFSYYFFDDIF